MKYLTKLLLALLATGSMYWAGSLIYTLFFTDPKENPYAGLLIFPWIFLVPVLLDVAAMSIVGLIAASKKPNG